MMNMLLFLAAFLAASVAFAVPTCHDGNKEPFSTSHKAPLRPPYMPQAKSATILANVTDPDLSRDSCGSVKMGFRTLWTCRDTSLRVPRSHLFIFIFGNTAAWTDNKPDGTPAIQVGGPEGAGSDGTNNILLMKGPQPDFPLFYPLGPNMCPMYGDCANFTSRWATWPDSPPMIANTALDGTVTAYTWVPNSHMVTGGLRLLEPQPSTSLYRMTYTPDPDPNVLPAVTTVDDNFWSEQEIAYGAYGNVVRDGYAYLYGRLDPEGVALARVPIDDIENKSQYEYYICGRWTNTKPEIDDTTVAVPNAGTAGQGTFYYSDRAQSYVWIGQASFSVWADFYISTAPRPEGPWTKPYLLYSGPNGDGDLPSYSLQAHPHMLREDDNGIYLTWTQSFKLSTYFAYVTPLVYVSFV